MPILHIRDKDGNFIPIPAIQGKSAYEQAIDGGYEGTEEEFIALLNGLITSVSGEHVTNFENPHRVTVEQLGSLKIYNSFAALNKALGTSFDSDTPIETIIEAMSDNTGLKADINTNDVGHSGTTIYPAVYGILSIYKIRSNRVEVEYVSNTASGGIEHNKRWIGQYNSGEFGGFVQVYTEQHKPKASDIGALPVSGGEMKGCVKWNNGKSHIVAQNDGNFIIQNYKVTEDGNDDFIAFHNILKLENVLKIYRNGQGYKIYGEHNKPTPSDIGAAKIAKGLYQGVDTDSANPSLYTLSFDFIPKIVIIQYSGAGSKSMIAMINGISKVVKFPVVGSSSSNLDYVTDISWGATSPSSGFGGYVKFKGFSYSNSEYHYIAIG